MAEVRSKARGMKFSGEFRWGGCWHVVRASHLSNRSVGYGRVVTFGSRAAARAAALECAVRFTATRAV